MSFPIYTVNGLCGAAKTYESVGDAIHLADLGRKVVIIQPTRALLTQTHADITRRAPAIPVRAFHHGVVPNPVPAIVEHTRNTGPGGEIMLITQSAFLRLPEFVRRHEWTVIIDEAPDPVWECTINLPETRERVFPILTELVDPVPHAALYFRLMPREGFLSALERMARNVQDDAAWKIFADAAARIASPHWDVYVIQSQYDAVLRGEAEQLTLFTVLRPTILMGFRTATVMSACFDDTLLARLWAGEVDFRPHRRITKRLRYHAHPNGHPLTIHYIFERDWSKNLREKRVNGVSALEYTAAEVTNLFGSEPFI